VDASLAGERVFHGDPSGIDTEVAARGGVLRFVRGEPPEIVVPGGPLPLLVIPTGIPRSTAEQVAKVRHRLQSHPRIGRPILEAISGCVASGLDALERNDLIALGEIMSICHELLGALGASHPRLDSLCSIATKAGALGAKLTGAGGGGCAVALRAGQSPPVEAALTAAGAPPLTVTITP
jgi:mevalonate kinase